MGLSFGWKAAEVRESIWKDDDAIPRMTKKVGDKEIEVPAVPQGALDAWNEDGDASHLEPYATSGEATTITFRTLTPDETRVAMAPFSDPASTYEAYSRSLLICFRIGVDFPGAPEKFEDAAGAMHPRLVKERGIRMLSNEFVRHLETAYPSIVLFYGTLVHRASFPTEVEKKVSSPPSTPTPSSAAVPTGATTEPSPSTGAATGAP